MSDTTVNDPAAIEREIRQTQEDMSRTVEKIGSQLNFKNVFNALLDKADENNVDARMLLDGARRNPVALGLIAAGAIWLVSDNDSKLPTRSDNSLADTASKTKPRRYGAHDYTAHMSSVEQRADEDAAAYQRRRDIARSNYFMIERGPDEDDTSFRSRLDAMTDGYRKTTHAWADSARNAGESTKQASQALAGQAQKLSGQAQRLYSGNPLLGGLVAAIVGAVAGSALPVTDMEESRLGDLGRQAKDALAAGTSKLGSQLHEQKDTLVEQADAALQPQRNDSAQDDPSRMSAQGQPFIAAQ